MEKLSYSLQFYGVVTIQNHSHNSFEPPDKTDLRFENASSVPRSGERPRGGACETRESGKLTVDDVCGETLDLFC